MSNGRDNIRSSSNSSTNKHVLKLEMLSQLVQIKHNHYNYKTSPAIIGVTGAIASSVSTKHTDIYMIISLKEL